MKRIATLTLAGSFLFLAGCKGGAEGVYKLDKTEMKKEMEAQIKDMPKEAQGMAKLGMALIDAMDITMTLKSGGEVDLLAKVPDLGGKEGDAPKDKKETGTWKQEGDTITISTKGEDKGKDLKCKLAEKKLTCDTGEKTMSKMVFVKEG